MIDVILVLIVLAVAWFVASDGAFGAITTFVAVIFSGLLAMNFFEPLAGLLQSQFPEYGSRFDLVSLVGLFALFVFLFRLGIDRIAPTDVTVLGWLAQPARWVFGAATGYVTMAILLTALHTAVLPREFLGFRPERKNFLSIAAPDRQWLAFTQHVTEKLFRRRRFFVISGQNRVAGEHLFDGFVYPNPEKSDSVYLLPSFLIRYASRRDREAGSATPPSAAPPTQAPTGAPTGAPGL